MRLGSWLRREVGTTWTGVTTIIAFAIAIVVGWSVWSEVDRWYSTTHVENMVGKAWEVRSADNTHEIEVLFTETSTVFAYEGGLPGYVREGEYFRALFQFSPDNNRIIEFIGPADEPGVSFRWPILLLAILGIVALAGVILYLITPRSKKRPLPRGGA